MVAAGRAAIAVNEEPESEGSKRFFAAFGIAADRLIFDDQSRNTEENAQFAKKLAGDTSGQTWLLVTSAYHMPRAVGLFREAGPTVIPWPTDYFSSGTEGLRLKPDEAPKNITVSTIALREWTGLLGYWMTGRVAEFFPGLELARHECTSPGEGKEGAGQGAAPSRYQDHRSSLGSWTDAVLDGKGTQASPHVRPTAMGRRPLPCWGAIGRRRAAVAKCRRHLCRKCRFRLPVVR